jgi:voltage-gated potassium channel Kch
VALSEHAVATDPSEAFATMLYFSFVTITTLGYGDIVPVSGAAKILSSGEALFGQIYLAVFIARLVALHVAAGIQGGDEE